MRRLHQQFAETHEAKILIIYQKEPHVGQMAFANISQPENFEERCELAKRMIDEYELPMDVLVDTMADSSRLLFTDLPSPVYVLDSKGVVQAKFPWPDQELIRSAVSKVVKNIKP